MMRYTNPWLLTYLPTFTTDLYQTTYCLMPETQEQDQLAQGQYQKLNAICNP